MENMPCVEHAMALQHPVTEENNQEHWWLEKGSYLGFRRVLKLQLELGAGNSLVTCLFLFMRTSPRNQLLRFLRIS